jgi:hypothetical protein
VKLQNPKDSGFQLPAKIPKFSNGPAQRPVNPPNPAAWPSDGLEPDSDDGFDVASVETPVYDHH